jgi:ribA/ribD-fused uncharacterized protein
MDKKEKFHLFWGGEFSQWYPSKFEIDGKKYNCAEQWMMEQKALFFGDGKMAKRIMEEKSPNIQKAFGKKVTPFDGEKWMEVCYDIVLKGNIAKFSQNPKLLKVLLDTGDIEIVEASPYDRIWGIGLSENDARAQDKGQWRGMNLLGKVVMDARTALK